jgi:transcriptional regulator with XRE-family HTH domain
MTLAMAGKDLGLLEMDSLGQTLKKLREGRRLSQQELANLAGMSAAALSKLERGLHEPSRQTLRGLAEGLKLTVDELEEKLRGETVSVELPRAVYDSIAERAAHKGYASVAAFLAKVATSKTIRVRKPPEEGGKRSAGSRTRITT